MCVMTSDQLTKKNKDNIKGLIHKKVVEAEEEKKVMRKEQEDDKRLDQMMHKKV